MKSMQIVFLAVVACVAMVVPAESANIMKVKVDTIKWSTDEQLWLGEKGTEFALYANTVILNPNVNNDIKLQLTSLVLWAAQTIPSLIADYAEVTVYVTIAFNDDGLQNVKTQIAKIKNAVNDAIAEIIKRTNQIYASIKKDLPNANSEGKKDLLEVQKQLEKRVDEHKAWQTETNGRGDAIAAEI